MGVAFLIAHYKRIPDGDDHKAVLHETLQFHNSHIDLIAIWIEVAINCAALIVLLNTWFWSVPWSVWQQFTSCVITSKTA